MMLTQEEFDALESGAEVVITWSGGNGPHRYRVSKLHDGTSTIYGTHGAWVGTPCCGETRGHDHVWLESGGGE